MSSVLAASDPARASAARDLADRVKELVPLLRDHAAATDVECKPADACIGALNDAGVFRMTTPLRFGGYELSVRDQFETVSTISSACPSSGWVTAIYLEGAFLLGLMSDQAQADVYTNGPDVRVTAVSAPTGKAVPADRGVTVTGRWAFNSGAHHGHWAALALMRVPVSGDPHPALALLPYDDLTLLDDWDPSGLRGSGSNTVTADAVFVPEHRLLPLADVMQGKMASIANAQSTLWRSAPGAFLFAAGLAVSVGLAQGALELFLERLPGRGITYSTYPSQLDAPITHLVVAGARLRVDGAELHALRAADTVDDAAAEGRPLTIEERAAVRGHVGRTTELCKEAVDLLVGSSGASSILSSVPIQRYGRDMQALYTHALLHPPTNQELYGRVLLGLEPNSHFL
jgi:alkylation response protein AidB-like acyl-CoA dehydrogenase